MKVLTDLYGLIEEYLVGLNNRIEKSFLLIAPHPFQFFRFMWWWTKWRFQGHIVVEEIPNGVRYVWRE